MLIKYLVKIPPKLEWIQGVIVTLVPHLELPGVVRVSLGIENRREDIDKLIHVLGQIAGIPKKQKEMESSSPNEGPQILSKKDIHKQMKDFVRERAAMVGL